MRNGVNKYFRFAGNKKQSEQELAQLEKDIAAGKISFSEQETTVSTNQDGKTDLRIEELAVKYLEWVKAKRSLGTFKIRQHYILQFLGFMGAAMLSDVTRIKLEEFYTWAKTNHSRSENGGNEALSSVKTMLLWGMEQELYELPFRKFPVMEHTPPETQRLNDDDLEKLLTTATGDFGDMLLFGLLTGLRPKELMELQKSNFHTGGDGLPYILIERHKTSRSARTPRPRTVPLCPDAHDILTRQLKSHRKSDIIFLNSLGTPYTRHSFKSRLARLCKRAKTSRIFTPYALRHTFASMESDNKEGPDSLSKLMGHSSTRTLQRYVTNTFKHHFEAVTSLQDRIREVRQGG